MFCPSCGLEEKQSNQFCRACGAELRSVRMMLEKSDSITASAVTARDEIGRAFAQKIRDTNSASELASVVEGALPGIEVFLESPEEKRLRRVRAGIITSSAGIGAVLMFLLMLSNGSDALIMIGAGLITFFIGLGIIINGLLFTVPKKSLTDNSADAMRQRELDSIENDTNELEMPKAKSLFSSVTEGTTRQLNKK